MYPDELEENYNRMRQAGVNAGSGFLEGILAQLAGLPSPAKPPTRPSYQVGSIPSKTRSKVSKTELKKRQKQSRKDRRR